MRITEVITEDFDDMIEDDADDRGDANLITALEFLRNRAGNKHLVPKVRADALINMVQNTGHPEFNFAALDAAFKSNDVVKNLIQKIEDDQNGAKYVYLSNIDPTANQDADGSEQGAAGLGPKNPEKTVSSMATRALDKRS